MPDGTYDSNPTALYVIGRIHPELIGSGPLKYNALVGLTLAQHTNDVVGGLLFEFNDFTNQSFDKLFSVALYAGIPITLK